MFIAIPGDIEECPKMGEKYFFIAVTI